MTTENLINQLSKNVEPVKPLPTSWRRMVKLLGTMVIGSGIIFALFSIRHDLHQAFFKTQFLMGLSFLFLSWLVSTYALAISQLPTRGSKKHFITGFSLISALSLMYLIKGILSPTESFKEGFAPGGLSCSLDILFLSLIPVIFLVVIIKKSAPINYLWSGINIGLTCATWGALLLLFSCPSEDPAHLLLWHLVVPMGALSLGGIFLGKKYLKW